MSRTLIIGYARGSPSAQLLDYLQRCAGLTDWSVDGRWQAEGKLDKAKGAVHKAVGDAKEAVKKGVDD